MAYVIRDKTRNLFPLRRTHKEDGVKEECYIYCPLKSAPRFASKIAAEAYGYLMAISLDDDIMEINSVGEASARCLLEGVMSDEAAEREYKAYDPEKRA